MSEQNSVKNNEQTRPALSLNLLVSNEDLLKYDDHELNAFRTLLVKSNNKIQKRILNNVLFFFWITALSLVGGLIAVIAANA